MELGVCVVTHDRAGYGRSTRRRGRTVADEAEDVVLLADSLGFERFGVSGGSGGGPHVLACAALLPDRVIRATCVVGIAPLGSPGLERDAWLAGMDPENVKEFGWAEAGEDVLGVELEREHAASGETRSRGSIHGSQPFRSQRVGSSPACAARVPSGDPGVDSRAGRERRVGLGG